MVAEKGNDTLELFSWYLNESIVNITLFSDTIKTSQAENKKKRFSDFELIEMGKVLEEGGKDGINFDGKTIETIQKLVYSMASDTQNNIFSFSLLKGGIISYFSIFEYYITSLGKIIGLPRSVREPFIEYLKRLFKSLGFGFLSEILGIDILKRYKEFYLRRNLYVHNYGIINENFIDSIEQQQLNDVLLDYNSSPERYKVGGILQINESYFLNNSVGLDVIGISITLFYFKSKYESSYFLEALKKIKSFMLNNGDYEIIYIKAYHVLVDELGLSKEYYFTLGYGMALVSIYKKVRNKKSYLKMKNQNIDKYIKVIEIKKLSIIELCLYYFIIDDSEMFFLTIRNEVELSKTGDIIGDCMSYSILCDYFLENVDLIKEILEKESVILKLSHSTTLNHVSKIEKLMNVLTNA